MLAGAGRDGVEHVGDLSAIQRLLSILDTPDVSFAIVTP
jgi:alkyl sulfatase BDS1-like metallo-beta-lactamase superfamily hydrolase